jgi:chemotaxis protein CheD
MTPASVGSRAAKPGDPRTVTVGIGELAVSADPGAVLVAYALGSCVAVCVWDPVARVAGLLHYLLPDSSIHLARARAQPGAFADSGIPLLFETAYRHGLQKARAVVQLVGGAETKTPNSALRQIGKRNVLAARKLLWQNGVLIAHEETGGTSARSLYLSAQNGHLDIHVDGDHIVIA